MVYDFIVFTGYYLGFYSCLGNIMSLFKNGFLIVSVVWLHHYCEIQIHKMWLKKFCSPKNKRLRRLVLRWNFIRKEKLLKEHQPEWYSKPRFWVASKYASANGKKFRKKSIQRSNGSKNLWKAAFKKFYVIWYAFFKGLLGPFLNSMTQVYLFTVVLRNTKNFLDDALSWLVF